MKIIALDANALTFDGLSWLPLQQLGEFIAYDKSSPEQGIERCKDAQAVIVNKFLINKEFLSQCKQIKYVGITATGTNNVDLKLCKEKGIVVTNVPAYSTLSVAQLVFSYICFHFNRLNDYQKLSHSWHESQNFCLPLAQHHELSALSICIVGQGAIGKKVAEIARAFEMNVLIPAIPGRNYAEQRLSLKEALNVADILTLHCPLSESTDKIINAQNLGQMKSNAILINTARGGLVDELALENALKNGQISAAYLDVLSKEPPEKNNSLINKAFITPHIAWATVEARTRLMQQTALNLKSYLENEPKNIVNL
jgi:glycerate dehydrogenase